MQFNAIVLGPAAMASITPLEFVYSRKGYEGTLGIVPAPEATTCTAYPGAVGKFAGDVPAGGVLSGFQLLNVYIRPGGGL